MKRTAAERTIPATCPAIFRDIVGKLTKANPSQGFDDVVMRYLSDCSLCLNFVSRMIYVPGTTGHLKLDLDCESFTSDFAGATKSSAFPLVVGCSSYRPDEKRVCEIEMPEPPADFAYDYTLSRDTKPVVDFPTSGKEFVSKSVKGLDKIVLPPSTTYAGIERPSKKGKTG